MQTYIYLLYKNKSYDIWELKSMFMFIRNILYAHFTHTHWRSQRGGGECKNRITVEWKYSSYLIAEFCNLIRQKFLFKTNCFRNSFFSRYTTIRTRKALFKSMCFIISDKISFCLPLVNWATFSVYTDPDTVHMHID